jgi:hypothetical protein
MEGCAPGVVCGTKKYAELPVVESVEPLPLHCPYGVDVVELLIESSALFAAASSFFLSFASSESNAILIISGLVLRQMSTSCSRILAKWYFNLQIICNSIVAGLSHLQGPHTHKMDPKASTYFLMKLTTSKFNPKAQKKQENDIKPH